VLVSKKAQNITPYTSGEQPQGYVCLKLNTNENAYPPSPQIKQYLLTADICNLRLYPDPNNNKLKCAIADSLGIEPDNIFVGNGSDEVLALAFLTYFEKTRGRLLMPDITYSFYPVYANLYDIQFESVPLDIDFGIRIDDYINKARKGKVCGIIFANPNAPTGILLSLSEIERLLIECPDVPVVVDEAYIDFAHEGASAISLLSKYPNLIVVRTFSKSHSLAGARVGYCAASTFLINALGRIKDCFNSYPLDRISADIAAISIADKDYSTEVVGKIVSTRGRTASKLKEFGCKILSSGANFLFVSIPGMTGQAVYRYLKDRYILVRNWSTGRIADFVRITIGTDEDMDILIGHIQELCLKKTF